MILRVFKIVFLLRFSLEKNDVILLKSIRASLIGIYYLFYWTIFFSGQHAYATRSKEIEDEGITIRT